MDKDLPTFEEFKTYLVEHCGCSIEIDPETGEEIIRGISLKADVTQRERGAK